jgi:hypothetical protein
VGSLQINMGQLKLARRQVQVNSCHSSKKDDLVECSTLSMIALIPHASKVMQNIILFRVKEIITAHKI